MLSSVSYMISWCIEILVFLITYEGAFSCTAFTCLYRFPLAVCLMISRDSHLIREFECCLFSAIQFLNMEYRALSSPCC